MRRRHGFASQWHFSPAPEVGNGMGPACGSAMVRRRRRSHDGARSTGDADVWGRAVGSGPAVADSGRSFPARAGPLAVAARRGRSRKLRDVGPMRRAAGRRVSWVWLQARMGRRPAIGDGGAVRGDDIGTLSGSCAAGAPACSERVAKSVPCGESGRYGACSRGTVLLAIAVDIASNHVNTSLAHTHERSRPQGPLLALHMPYLIEFGKLVRRPGACARPCRRDAARVRPADYCSR